MQASLSLSGLVWGPFFCPRICKTFLMQGKREVMGYWISKVRMGDLQVIEEAMNTHDRKIPLGDSEAMGRGVI